MISYYIDGDGYPRAEGAEPFSNLCSFLEQDVQTSEASCDEYLVAVQNVRSSIVLSWTGTGNAHTVTIGVAGVVIENEWALDDRATSYSLDEFEAALNNWSKLISFRPAR